MRESDDAGGFSRPAFSAAAGLAGPEAAAGAGAPRAAAFVAHAQPPQPLPAPTGEPPFRLELSTVVGADAVAAIEQRGTLTFQTVGDTGGVKSPEAQEIVTMWMEHEFE